ncbi:RluA family pseudouridine synthase [Ligilactobacillus equi]|uniref:RNA pseudouridylate synthase n=1 Tax=Ligilactobacillus equi DSM 15833 = JCM 10991 TaxID=1423740 RepID=A0A0R1TIY6_9LACO|nr:RluA family pseudouridine synthase [Ligilactobacillus equi]KRL78693.1 RluA family pseudouridine synthase [Ligilactobacillus equi DSM 15833 = JCM 10991]
MEFKIIKRDTKPQSLRNFLTAKKMSGRLQTKIRRGLVEVYWGQEKLTLTSKLKDAGELRLITLEPEASQAITASTGEIKVVYEDSNYLVADKPAGLASVPGPSETSDTLANRIKGYLLAQGLNDVAVHVLTRLDYNTSGLVLVAKNSLAQGWISAYQDQMIKEYRALVSGHLAQASGRLDFPLQKDSDSFRQIVTAAGKKALTDYWLLESYPKCQLVKVILQTGRTHQIRAHFAHLGHPLVGDELYGGPRAQELGRQLLHAHKLSFYDPFSGQLRSLTSSLPEIFAQACQS